MKTTERKSLEKMIQEGSFDYVNPHITEGNFPAPKDGGDVAFDLWRSDRAMSSEDAMRGMSEDGWRPASVYELLEWDGWNGIDTIVALGSVAEIDGGRRVPYLDEGGSGRRLYLYWIGADWGASCRFLRVRDSDSRDSSTSNRKYLPS